VCVWNAREATGGRRWPAGAVVGDGPRRAVAATRRDARGSRATAPSPPEVHDVCGGLKDQRHTGRPPAAVVDGGWAGRSRVLLYYRTDCRPATVRRPTIGPYLNWANIHSQVPHHSLTLFCADPIDHPIAPLKSAVLIGEFPGPSTARTCRRTAQIFRGPKT
jgi:hypothetical protein